jgi:hypothetical protein
MHQYRIRYRILYLGHSNSRVVAIFDIEVLDLDIEEKPLISCMIFNFEGFCTLDMYSISKFLFDIEYNIVLQYLDIRISKVKTLMPYMISMQCRDIRISTFFLQYQRFARYLGTICHTLGGWAHRPRRRYTGSSGPADGSTLLVLDPLGWSVLLCDCLDALSYRTSAAFCCCKGPALVMTAGLSRCHGGQS